MSDAMGLPGGPAFPISIPGCGDNGCHGMSLRDWFAGQALAGICTRVTLDAENILLTVGCAYSLADAMLEQRSKEQK